MRAILFILLILGIGMLVDGLYQEEIARLKNSPEIKYKIVPRSQYYESIFGLGENMYDELFDKEHDARSAGRYSSTTLEEDNTEMERFLPRPYIDPR
jgi:hypothetical protein